MTRIEFARLTAQIVNRASVWTFENVAIAQTSGPNEAVRQDVLNAFSAQITDLLDDLKPAPLAVITSSEQK